MRSEMNGPAFARRQVELLGLPKTVVEGALVKGKLQLSSRGGPVSGIRLLAAEPDLVLNEAAELATDAEPEAEPSTGRQIHLGWPSASWAT